MTYYFTYGAGAECPFHGGWTEIDTSDRETAIERFHQMHPGVGNYCSCLDEYEFRRTPMWVHGNFGERAHERDVYWREQK